jgi:hypothetical protein
MNKFRTFVNFNGNISKISISYFLDIFYFILFKNHFPVTLFAIISPVTTGKYITNIYAARETRNINKMVNFALGPNTWVNMVKGFQLHLNLLGGNGKNGEWLGLA